MGPARRPSARAASWSSPEMPTGSALSLTKFMLDRDEDSTIANLKND
jgi:hypothetical protein